MYLTWLDWTFVAGIVVAITLIMELTRKYCQGVTDFLAAGRSARRYLLTTAAGVDQYGASKVVSQFEMIFLAGFCILWWGLFNSAVYWMLGILGWVTYRFRETRALTLAQYFEMRYSRTFRVFMGLLMFVAGLISGAVYPQVGAKFFVYYCGLPETIHIGGLDLSLAAVLTIALVGYALYTVMGGQIGQMLTDFCEGFVSHIVFIIILIFLFWFIPWSKITEALVAKPPGQSMLNPFDTKGVADFNVWYFAIQAFIGFYARMAWQGGSGYNAAAASPHEGRMGTIVGQWKAMAFGLMLVMLPIGVYVVMNHPDYAPIAAVARERLAAIPDAQIRQQSTVSMVLTVMLPDGIRGLFCAIMFAGFIGSMNTGLHSFGTIFIQDVVMPLRKKRLDPKTHVRLLRASIVGVAAFVAIFSILWRQNEYILMFSSGSMAIFTAGAGAVIIGGLYWRRGTTAGAWTAILTGSIVMTVWMIARQWLPRDILNQLPNSQRVAFFMMLTCSALYIAVSWLTSRKPYPLDQLLHRGAYAGPDKTGVTVRRGWGRLLNITSDFTRWDKALVIASLVWLLGWFLFALAGTLYTAYRQFDPQTWSSFWKVKAWIGLVLGILATIWVTIGSLGDLKFLLRRLKTAIRNPLDDGTVSGTRSLADLKPEPGAEDTSEVNRGDVPEADGAALKE